MRIKYTGHSYGAVGKVPAVQALSPAPSYLREVTPAVHMAALPAFSHMGADTGEH